MVPRIPLLTKTIPGLLDPMKNNDYQLTHELFNTVSIDHFPSKFHFELSIE